MTKNNFDKIIDETIGFIRGSGKVLFIKTGQGGSIYGYENKYLNLAIEVNEKYGYSVFVSSSISDKKDAYERDMQLLEQCIGTTDYEVYYLGVSKGGLIGLWHGATDPKIKRIVTVNAPLMLNFHNKTVRALEILGFDKLTMVYGSRDPSYIYTPFLNKRATYKIIEGADHNLVNSSLSLLDIVTEMLI